MGIYVFRVKRLITILLIIILFFLLILFYKDIGRILFPIKYRGYIDEYAYKYSIDPLLVASIIKTESGYDKDALSSKGAMGLMQILPSTGKWAAENLKLENFNEEKLYNPETNIMIGCWYINNLNNQFDDELRLVLAAYNGGSGNVSKWLKNEKYSNDGKELNKIPFKETEDYIEKVLKTYKLYKIFYR
ncbi:lytic transglycosylase domain-containing protein [Clostridiisalibacter paucivorans]|uniref:lytic transglycosylase domain-containing protein n=1 Tax=Clostridiisalibacter paucivorans TaxID=408753 RepID=UPI000A4045B4|nr:lytic transglycosylase domain-containing protein [Clostridiisalibacter paucivorans]